MNNTIAIGCLVQWYEVQIVKEYISSLKHALEDTENAKEKVLVDFCICLNQDLEKINEDKTLEDLKIELLGDISELSGLCKLTANVTDTLYTVADYRRDFNRIFCEKADLLMWGESDCLIPKQTFTTLDLLHSNISAEVPKYLATFAICKMWDNSWKPLEHPEFTDKPFIEMDTKNWWSLRYTMTEDEMNSFNDKVDELALTVLHPHKYNGCGLVISSQVIKAGVNIPQSVFFVHEDTAMMLMTQRILGVIPQYHIQNILIVHNRKHPNKRAYIRGEEGIDKTITGQLRSVHTWYDKANQMCEQNCYNLFNPKYNAFSWKDVGLN